MNKETPCGIPVFWHIKIFWVNEYGNTMIAIIN
jgi:hypothetical protein